MYRLQLEKRSSQYWLATETNMKKDFDSVVTRCLDDDLEKCSSAL